MRSAQLLPWAGCWPSMRILLVEDNELNRDMLRRRLVRHGHVVESAADGAEAVAKALANPYDVVLMDIELPVLDGWQAIGRIKASPSHRMLPIIVLSGFALTETRDHAFRLGCVDFLTKPLDFAHLLESIARHTGLKATR
jgi:CheY-like chemotaxis protein